jgi:hypothetical protein
MTADRVPSPHLPEQRSGAWLAAHTTRCPGSPSWPLETPFLAGGSRQS